MKPPFFVQTVFGILGGIGPHPEDVMHMKRTADRLFGKQLQMVGARRGPQSAADRRAGRGDGRQRARRARGLALGRRRAGSRPATPSRCAPRARSSRGSAFRVASPDEAREILELKGGDGSRSDRGFETILRIELLIDGSGLDIACVTSMARAVKGVSPKEREGGRGGARAAPDAGQGAQRRFRPTESRWACMAASAASASRRRRA